MARVGKEKVEAARQLYLEGWTNKDIAKALQLNENTIGRWAASGDWEEDRIHQQLVQDNSVQRIIRLIDYQTRALERKTRAWLEDDPESVQLIDRGDIDALQKLFVTIKQDGRKWKDYLIILKEFADYLQHVNLDLAKKVAPLADKFLNEKTKLL